MKITVKNRMALLCPSVNYGNITLESSIELADDVAPQFVNERTEELQLKVNKLILQSLHEQKQEVDKLESKFFKVNI